MGLRTPAGAATRSSLVILALALLSPALAAGCGSTGMHATRAATTRRATNSRGSDADSPSALFTKGWPTGAGGECDGHTPGARDILMTFCHGHATLMATIEGSMHTLKGGVCWMNGPTLELDIGVATATGFSGKAPDYVTAQLPTTAGQHSWSTPVLLSLGGSTAVVGSASVVIAPTLAKDTQITQQALDGGSVTGTIAPGIEGFTVTDAAGQHNGSSLDVHFTC